MPRSPEERAAERRRLKRALRERAALLRESQLESQKRRLETRAAEQRVSELERELAKARAEADRAAEAARPQAALEERLKVTSAELARRRLRTKKTAHAPGTDARFLFVAGTPRSGTAEITTLLNQDPRILVGGERYRLVLENLEPFFFVREVFAAPVPSETPHVRRHNAAVFPSHISHYVELTESRWEQLAYLGDANPAYHLHLKRLLKTFPGCRIVFMVRDVEGIAATYDTGADDGPDATAYRRGVEEWSDALLSLRRFARRGHRGGQLLVVRHEDLLSGNEDVLLRLYRFLELEAPSEGPVLERFAALAEEPEGGEAEPAELDPAIRRFIALRRDPSTDDWLANYLASEPKPRRALLRRND